MKNEHLFCRKTGIQSRLLQGFVKGENYYLGEEINDKHKSAWLALLLGISHSTNNRVVQ